MYASAATALRTSAPAVVLAKVNAEDAVMAASSEGARSLPSLKILRDGMYFDWQSETDLASIIGMIAFSS